MRLNGNGALTLEDARTWIEETGLCLFLPKRQFSTSIAPSFVEAVAGKRDTTPHPDHVALAEELLVRLEIDGVAVRLNLLGLPGEQPDFVVASWVLPYVYALRGDRDWRRSPQLTGSRQVSQLAVQAYKLLEAGDTTIPKLTHALGREVTEGAVLRAITELWQQLRIIPIISAPGETAKWQLLRLRFQKAIAEGASTSQVTAISVLASIYLQAVIAAGMEEVELFLAPLTARSKVREVLRGLVATRQVHTISMGHAPLYYVAGTLPEFAVAPTVYASISLPASAHYLHFNDREEDLPEEVEPLEEPAPAAASKPVEAHAPRTAARKPVVSSKSAAARPHFSRPATQSRDRKPAQSSSSSRPARRTSVDSRPAGSRTGSSARPASGARWSPKPASGTTAKRNGTHPGAAASGGNGHKSTARPATRPSNGASGVRSAKSSAPAWSQRKGSSNSVSGASKPGAVSRNGSKPTHAVSAARNGNGSRKPTLTAGTKAGNSKQFGYTARPKQGTKKRG